MITESVERNNSNWYANKEIVMTERKIKMGLGKDALYDLYDGSWEQKFTERYNKDVFGIRGSTPEVALSVLTDRTIEQEVNTLVDNAVELDNGSLGIRKDVLTLGLTERYQGLILELEAIGNDSYKAVEELMKKSLGLTPREVLFCSLNVDDEDKKSDFCTSLVETLLETEDKMNVEVLYNIASLLHQEDDGRIFNGVVAKTIKTLDLLAEYTYESRLYNPKNLIRAIREDCEGDVKWSNVSDAGYIQLDDYLPETETREYIGVYLEYLDKIKPMKESKALVKVWEDDEFYKDLTKDAEGLYTFKWGKYVFRNDVVVMLRDGLTIVEPNGEFKHIPSSKVTKAVKDEVIKRLS